MKKTLICAEDVELRAKEGMKEIFIDKNTIVTPSAKDAAKALGIAFSLSPCPCATPSSDKSEGEVLDREMVYQVLKHMADKGMLKQVFPSIDEPTVPYEAERDCGGVKVVRGKSVRLDPFDTGQPGVKASFQELVHKEEAAMSAGFLTIENSRFAWDLTYEEVDYVIEGTLTVTVNGKTYTAYPGDVLFVPSGTKVIWGSPDKARIFYTTYPANWPDLLP